MQLAHEGGRPSQPDARSTEPTECDADEVVYDWDLATDCIRWGPNLAKVTGIADCARLATGLGYAEHLAPESPTSRYDAVMAPGGCDSGGGVTYTAIYALRPTRRSTQPAVWIEDCGRWFADARDRPGRAHGVIRDITRRVEADHAALAASRDPLTGAFSRAHFNEHLVRQLNLAGRRSATFAVLLIGIDFAGAPAADTDAMLAAAASRLRMHMRARELLARHAETQFAVLLENCNAEQTDAAAARFIEAIEAAAPGAPKPRAQVGAVLAPIHGRTPQALLQCAEETLEAARQPAGAHDLRHDPDTARAVGRPAAKDEVLAALDDGRVLLALQPVVEAGSRRIAFHEALVRIRRLDGSLLLPQALLPSAERTGLVERLDRRVLELAIVMLSADRRLALSINASVASLGHGGWLDHLRAACRLRPDVVRRLTVEITETSLVADLDSTRRVLSEIKPFGVKIAIDDFGAGHSSFRTLRQLPIDYLKIDGAFAQNLSGSADDRFFIRTLIDLARNLRIPTVAEWVEDEATARVLTDWGVEYLQGHLFGEAKLAGDPAPARARASW